MKIRTGYVSNSSSSSFVIPTAALSPIQKFLIKNHKMVVDKMIAEGDVDPESFGYWGEYDEWTITDDGYNLHCRTTMNNFNLRIFAEMIGVPGHLIKWTGYC